MIMGAAGDIPQHVQACFMSADGTAITAKSPLQEDAALVLEEAGELASTAHRVNHDPEAFALLLEELESLQAHVLDLVSMERENETVVGRLQAALAQSSSTLQLTEQALQRAEGELIQERRARLHAEKALAKTEAEKRKLASKVIEACESRVQALDLH